MSRATENVAKSVLSGVVMTAGFFSGAIIKSSAGKRIFKLMPGEVALVSLDAFGTLQARTAQCFLKFLSITNCCEVSNIMVRHF